MLIEASQGHLTALIPLVEKWSGNEDVLNWGTDHCGDTAVCHACFGGYLPVVRLLASTPGVDINMSGGRGRGRNALMTATIQGKVHIVHFLLTVPGIDINKRSAEYWMTALDMAERHKKHFGDGFESRDYPAMSARKQQIAVLLRAAGAEEDDEDDYGYQ